MEKWKIGRTWLIYDYAKKLMYCSLCRELGIEETKTLKVNEVGHFIKGTTNFRKTTVTDHGASEMHKHTETLHKSKMEKEQNKLDQTQGWKGYADFKR